MTTKPRLAVCISRFQYGGQGTVVEEELRHLAGDFSISLVTEKVDRPVPADVDAVELRASSSFPMVNADLRELLRTFDLIHCHDSLAFMYAAATSRLPYFVTCHGIAPLRFHGSPKARLQGAVTLLTYPRLYRAAEQVI